MLRRHGWVRVLIRDVEGNPQTQYKIHRFAMRFWLANAVVAVIVFTFAPGVWAEVSVLYLVLVSLYANWSTDFGAMSAAEAAAEGSVSEYTVEADATAERLHQDDQSGGDLP